MLGRDLLLIAVVAVEVRCNGHVMRASVGDEVIWTGQPVEARTYEPTDGTLELYLSTWFDSRICAIFVKNRPVAIETYPTLPRQQLDPLLNQLAHRQMLSSAEKEWTDLRREWLDVETIAHDMAWHSLPPVLEQLYVESLALVFVRDQELSRIVEAMRSDGFWHLLERDGDLVRGLALLGLTGAPQLMRPSARTVFQQHGLDFEQIVTRLTAIGSTRGIPVVADEGSRVVVSV
jgi:hypothetical protein